MQIAHKILEKVEDFLRTVIVKYWYIDATVTVFAFIILLIIQRIREKKMHNNE
ncbi:hypothetical protein [Acidianus bottle-shaped virus 3 strain ABV3]|uniref:Uncharacterized protein n=1 Tax=Acidianus bottle-shaped virus 3 strain ABV3 TaxID=1732174 RepID=A0A0N9PCR6_9VIRU|nr:hypothetical protein AVU00_gp59 [Acidianus bottle-shaped virus 3 strain ABV3]ALG96861.1 hypothetical protein [Acidianus bottle-shaped virus 3 strain ABV3]